MKNGNFSLFSFSSLSSVYSKAFLRFLVYVEGNYEIIVRLLVKIFSEKLINIYIPQSLIESLMRHEI
jgi:hypothetical protein